MTPQGFTHSTAWIELSLSNFLTKVLLLEYLKKISKGIDQIDVFCYWHGIISLE